MAPRPTDEGGNPIETLSLRRDQQAWLSFGFDGNELVGPGTEVFRYRAEPVTPELPYGLYYVDVLSTSLAAGVNVYYLEIYVTVAADGTVEEVVPTVHVQGWDGPKVSDPGWRIELDEEAFALMGGNAYLNALGNSSNLGALGNRARNGYVPTGTDAFGGGGYAGTSDGASSSDAASGNGGAASAGAGSNTSAGAGSNAAGTGANAGSAGSGSAGARATGAAGGADSANGAAGSPGSGATAAGAAGAAGTASGGVARATAGTDVIGGPGSAVGLATTGDVTSVTVPLSLALTAALVGCVGLTRRLCGKGKDR